jgi:hypothetical protein
MVRNGGFSWPEYAPGPSVDWNSNCALETSIVFDTNASDTSQTAACGAVLSTLTDFNDYGSLNLRAVSNLSFGNKITTNPLFEEVEICQVVPTEFVSTKD